MTPEARSGPRYYAAAMQTSLPALRDRTGIDERVRALLEAFDGTLEDVRPIDRT